MRRGALFAVAAVALAGCLGAPSAPLQAEAQAPAPATVVEETLRFDDFEGTLLSLPVVGGEARFPYTVPEGAGWLAATLKWSTRGTTLTLQALDPVGQPHGDSRTLAGSGPRAPARLDWWQAEPAAGEWAFVVQGQAALQEPLALQIHTLATPQDGMHIAEGTRVREGTFVEVNMNFKAGQVVHYDWTSEAPLYFNIHTHKNGETLNLVENTTVAMRGSYTAEEDEIASLLWEVPDAAAVAGARSVALAYRADGNYTLHSAAG
jgi:hypothetical protein